MNGGVGNEALTGIAFEPANARAPLEPPDGRPLIVHVVVNVEYWRYDQPMPRAILPAPHGRAVVPDVPNFGWVEYGLRCGLPRITRVLDAYGVRASSTMNAGIVGAYPRVAEAVLEAGWEIVAHGVVQRSLAAEDDEGAVIREAVETLGAFAGARPRGWLGPGLQQTPRTPALLRQAGIEWVCDWVLDDLPVWIRTPAGPLIGVPYSLELNDSVLHAVERHPSGEIFRRLELTLEALEPELARGPRVVTLGLHPHLIGVPHRIGYLARALELLTARQDAVFMTGSEIADWFAARSPGG
jgi:peptidoglycan/xylan/chitin deacetylase (PgdA/CDA1 family)